MWSTFQNPFSASYIFFWSSGSQESNVSNGVQIEPKMRKLCMFEASWSKKNVEFEIHSTFRTQPPWFQIGSPYSTNEFEIDLEFTQISNLATDDQVWALKHVKTSFKCLNPIWNAL